MIPPHYAQRHGRSEALTPSGHWMAALLLLKKESIVEEGIFS
jgi:hypothetical protein